GRPIDTDIPATPANVFQAKPQRDRLTTYDELKDQLKDQSKFQLLDVRTAEEFQAGKISTCTHFDWQELVDSKTGKLLPAAKLQAKLKEAGFDADRPVVTYCQSGGRASVMAFALELMGADEVANYHGSWGDWTRQ